MEKVYDCKKREYVNTYTFYDSKNRKYVYVAKSLAELVKNMRAEGLDEEEVEEYIKEFSRYFPGEDIQEPIKINLDIQLDYKTEYEKLLKENQNLKIKIKKMLEVIENLSFLMNNKEE